MLKVADKPNISLYSLTLDIFIKQNSFVGGVRFSFYIWSQKKCL